MWTLQFATVRRGRKYDCSHTVAGCALGTGNRNLLGVGAGVRARQEKVPFATCEDEGMVEAEVLPLIGEP